MIFMKEKKSKKKNKHRIHKIYTLKLMWYLMFGNSIEIDIVVGDADIIWIFSFFPIAV